MTTAVDICNAALDLLGAAAISALDDSSKESRLCARRYAPVLNAVLRAYPWNAAAARARLAPERLAGDGATTVFAMSGFTAADGLKVTLEANGAGTDWSAGVEYALSGATLTAADPPPAGAEIVVELTPPLFRFAHQHKLPADCLRVLSAETPEAYAIEGARLLAQARAVDIAYVAAPADPAGFDALLREALAARLAAEMAYPLVNSSALAESLWRLYEYKLREARSIDAQEGTPAPFHGDPWIAARG